MNVLDDYMIDSRLSLLDKTRIQAQVLVPLLQALRVLSLIHISEPTRPY